MSDGTKTRGCQSQGAESPFCILLLLHLPAPPLAQTSLSVRSPTCSVHLLSLPTPICANRLPTSPQPDRACISLISIILLQPHLSFFSLMIGATRATQIYQLICSRNEFLNSCTACSLTRGSLLTLAITRSHIRMKKPLSSE